MMEKDLEFIGDMFPLEKEQIYEAYIAADCNVDNAISSLIAHCEQGPRRPPTYEEAVSNGNVSGAAACSSESYLTKKRRDSRRNLGKKEWKLPITGRLTDDFLKVPSEILHNSASIGYNCKGCAKLNQKEMYEETNGSVVSSMSSTMRSSNFEDIDSIIRRRMVDNVTLTRCATMSTNGCEDNIQYLDDERLALMLQNQEFRNMVKSDPEFQHALEEDVKDQDFELPGDIWQEREESIVFRPQDFPLDYGYERSDIVDPDEIWPDRPTVTHNHDVSAVVKAMGKASKKRLSSIAKRFTSMRRGRSSRGYPDVDSFEDFSPPPRSYCYDTSSIQDSITDMDSVSCVGRPERPVRHPMSIISERSAGGTLI